MIMKVYFILHLLWDYRLEEKEKVNTMCLIVKKAINLNIKENIDIYKISDTLLQQT